MVYGLEENHFLAETDDMNESEPQKAGALLRDCRVKSGISLKDVAEKTKIRQTYLKALEEDYHEGLPGGAYRSGFMRIYAEFLGLSPDVVLERYRQQNAVETPEATDFEQPDEVTPRWGRRNLAMVVVLLLALVGAGVFLLSRPLPTESPQLLANKPKTSSRQPPPGAWSPPAEFVASAPLPNPQLQSPKHDRALPQQTSAAAAGAQRDAGNRTMPAAAAVSATPSSPEPEVREIRLETVAAVEFAIAVDGRSRREYNVPANVVLKWQAREGVRLETEDPDALRVWMDNRLIETAQWPLVLPRAAAGSPQ